MQFDISTVNRVAKEIEESGRRMQAVVNSPNELAAEIQKIQSSLDSIQSLTQAGRAAGANVNTEQHAPNQNQS
ncbi:hypothetical protein [Paenibacillus alkalitolerans]|uniref:hypothetical protein n=1 Tax=Paenibacillus alkalitolerans TaxID=2799335 RepID=UPI0018F6DB09|nr:hypothetical protein [Paenibacillus alkalitolerans]